MICAVMQPMYLPWAGYFNLIATADHFYYLDDAQYERGTWQHRNRILLNGKPQFLSIPVRRESLGQSICEVRTDPRDVSWRRKHSETLRYAYLKAPFGQALSPVRELIQDAGFDGLADLNIAITELICGMLSLETPRERTSRLAISGARSWRLIELCRRAGCDEYLSPQGAQGYLIEDRFTELSEVRLSFQDFVPASYPQGRNPAFESHLSILDVIAHLGPEGARRYVQGITEKS